MHRSDDGLLEVDWYSGKDSVLLDCERLGDVMKYWEVC